jgi:hypothetical protein
VVLRQNWRRGVPVVKFMNHEFSGYLSGILMPVAWAFFTNFRITHFIHRKNRRDLAFGE